jgi:hypothetical protein
MARGHASDFRSIKEMLTMSLQRRPYAPAIVLALVTTFVGVVSAKRPVIDDTKTVLAIEIPMKNGPFTVPAAMPGTDVYAHIRVPSVDSAKALPDQVTAVRLMPRVVEGRVTVKVYALYGDVSKVASCDEWKHLKGNYVGEYTAGSGEEFQVKELAGLGASFGEQPLTVHIVPMKVKPRGQDPIVVTACQCATCGGLSCCPNNGKCIGCGDCGSACCSISEQ